MMLNKILFKISGYLPCRLIYSNDRTPYLERYHLFSFLGITIDLHRFVGADGDRFLHNHPWRYAFSFMLCGGYMEKQLVSLFPTENETIGAKTVERTAPGFRLIKSADFHQIIDILPGTWTIFVHTPNFKHWGFLKDMDGSNAGLLFPRQPYGITKNWYKTATKGNESDREPC